MKILIANPGSTSYKCKLFQFMDDQRADVLFESTVERIGDKEGKYAFTFKGEERTVIHQEIPDYSIAVALTLNTLSERISIREIAAVGFKTVLAKDVSGCVELNDNVLSAMKEFRTLAPVHTDAYLTAISIFKRLLDSTPLIGLFETHFHEKGIPPEAYLYGIPYEYYEKYGIRKYGFHSASHRYIAEKAKELFNADKVISCHLGGSSSVCAIKNGRSVDTSMGMSPQSGLLNAKRVGDLDPFALLFLMERENLTTQQVSDILLFRSGVLGIAGFSGDFRDIERAMQDGNQRATLAFKTFAYYVKRYIGEYLAVLNGTDCIIFTGGAGENSPLLRQQILSDLENLGIILDNGRNQYNVKEGLISSKDSKVKVAVIPSNEEYIVAREVRNFLSINSSFKD